MEGIGSVARQPLFTELAESKAKATEQQIDEWFEHFWSIVWAKTGKVTARAAFGKQVTCRDDAALIFKAAKRHGPAIMRRAEGGSTPVHPSTWLNQRRFLEEPPVVGGRRPTVVVADPAEIEAQRREITPDQAQQINARLIAKMRAEYEAAARDPQYRAWILREFPELRKEVGE